MYHSPLKIYEYAALGVSIVCTPSADAEMLRETGSKVHFVETGHSTLTEAMQEALHDRQGMSEGEISDMRQAVSVAHSWEQRMKFVMDEVENRSTVRLPEESTKAVA